MHGRQWSDGLHQAVEAKEAVVVKEESQTLATITLQNFFKLYDQIAGMTGTAATEANEFMNIYKLEVVVIPTNEPCIRDDREDGIVAKAGQQHKGRDGRVRGNVTIATNMAGRGTDIKLGPGVADIGGLHILGTERHEARRIDNQLRGRAGRQGDAGSSLFFLSFDDDLMRIFAPDWTVKALSWIGWEEGQPIIHKRISKGIEKAQKKVEERNFEIRKSLLEYDEVMDYQRKIFYSRRKQILKGQDLKNIILEMLHSAVARNCQGIMDSNYPAR